MYSCIMSIVTVHLHVCIIVSIVALPSPHQTTHLMNVQVRFTEWGLVLLVIGGHGLALVGYASNV